MCDQGVGMWGRGVNGTGNTTIGGKSKTSNGKNKYIFRRFTRQGKNQQIFRKQQINTYRVNLAIEGKNAE